MNTLMTILALAAIAALVLVGLGVLMLPAYLWQLWRTSTELDEARRAGLID